MKAISLGFIALFSTAVSFAQIKVSDKAVIKTPTVQCDVCKDKVEFFVSHIDGVTSVRVNPRQKTTTVTWLTDRTTLENIKVSIANLGYDADNIEAEEYAYKRLPKSCKAHIKPVTPPELKLPNTGNKPLPVDLQ